jgi:hypothetical protein
VGGSQEALSDVGECAISDPDTAARLMAGRLAELKLARRNPKMFGPGRGPRLQDFASAPSPGHTFTPATL